MRRYEMPLALTLKGLLYLSAQRASGIDISGPYSTIVKVTRNPERLSAGVEGFLKEVLIHAYRKVPYYHAIFEEHHLVDGGKVDLSRFPSLPVLTKGAVRNHVEDLKSVDIGASRAYSESTSGSTGEPLMFWKDRAHDSWRLASLIYYYKELLGLDYLGARKLFFGSPFRFPPNGLRRSFGEWLTSSARLDGLLLTEGAMEGYVRKLNSFQPEVVQGMAGSLLELSRFIGRRGLKVHRPKALISTDEMLLDFMREEIEGVFGAKVYNLYGSLEAGEVAAECDAGSMHVFAANNFVEVLGEGRGEGVGEIVVTPLHNFAMPLIRYRIGDEASMAVSKCSCGSVLPTMGEIQGRTTDYFVRGDGGLVHGEYFLELLRGGEGIDAFQVTQEERGKIRILLAAKRVDAAWQDAVEEKVRVAMGTDCKLTWELVDEVPRGPTEKRHYLRCLVSPP
jgi:phenylacetate-CoA ligase